MSHEFSQLSFDTVIPSAILMNDNIEMNAVKLYAFIKGLTRAYGYCFATNEYLSNLMKADIRSIQRWITMLKKEGYLEVETEKNGIQWQRRLYISDKFKKSLRRDINVTPPWHGCHPPMTSVSPITKEYSKEDKLKGEEAPSPIFYQIHKRVRMTSQKYDSLVHDFGVEKIQEMMERLDQYADINPKRFKQYGCHGAVIRKWITDDTKKSNEGFKGHINENKAYSRKVVETLKHRDIEITPESLRFINHGAGGDFFISFNQLVLGFKEQVLNRLRKMNLPTNGL